MQKKKAEFFWVRTKISLQHIVWENLTKGHALTTTKSGWLTSVFTLMGPPRALESKPILELVLPRKSGDLGRIFVGGSRDFPESSASSIKKVAVFWDFLGNTKMGFNSIWLCESLWIACVRVFKSHFFSKWILWYFSPCEGFLNPLHTCLWRSPQATTLVLLVGAQAPEVTTKDVSIKLPHFFQRLSMTYLQKSQLGRIQKKDRYHGNLNSPFFSIQSVFSISKL